MKLIKGNCLEEMKKMPDKSVDLLICDLPYGETNCSWDTVIDMEEFWVQFKRLRKSKRTACIHFCSTKFGYSLIKSWEKGFKMDMVWKKRNKTGGLASRYRPMRNHEMVYFFYEQAPKYNRDKYHKRINNVKHAKSETTQEKKSDKEENKIIERKTANFEPANPASVIVEDEEKYTKEHLDNNRAGAGTNNVREIYTKENRLKYQKENGVGFEPPNPSSVIEETDIYGECKSKRGKRVNGLQFEPPNPASIIEEKKVKLTNDNYTKEYNDNNHAGAGVPGIGNVFSKENRKRFIKENGANFEPPNPASVIEEKYTKEYLDNKQKTVGTGSSEMQGIFTKENLEKWRKENGGFEPPNPASIIEEDEEKIWGEKKKDRHQRYLDCGCGYFEPVQPASVYESGKVFIGKRNHQTEKPQDILEFFLKYYSDEGDVIMDPTMGSGSTGVACKKMGREFIGIELTEKYYEVAKQRCGVEN